MSLLQHPSGTGLSPTGIQDNDGSLSVVYGPIDDVGSTQASTVMLVANLTQVEDDALTRCTGSPNGSEFHTALSFRDQVLCSPSTMSRDQLFTSPASSAKHGITTAKYPRRPLPTNLLSVRYPNPTLAAKSSLSATMTPDNSANEALLYQTPASGFTADLMDHGNASTIPVPSANMSRKSEDTVASRQRVRLLQEVIKRAQAKSLERLMILRLERLQHAVFIDWERLLRRNRSQPPTPVVKTIETQTPGIEKVVKTQYTQTTADALAPTKLGRLPPRSPPRDRISSVPVSPMEAPQLAGVGLVIHTMERKEVANGMTRVSHDTVTVDRVIPGKAAALNGLIRCGDQLVKVDDKEVHDLPLDTVCDLIKGPVGSTVNLVLARSQHPLEVGVSADDPPERVASPRGLTVYAVSLKRGLADAAAFKGPASSPAHSLNNALDLLATSLAGSSPCAQVPSSSPRRQELERQVSDHEKTIAHLTAEIESRELAALVYQGELQEQAMAHDAQLSALQRRLQASEAVNRALRTKVKEISREDEPDAAPTSSLEVVVSLDSMRPSSARDSDPHVDRLLAAVAEEESAGVVEGAEASDGDKRLASAPEKRAQPRILPHSPTKSSQTRAGHKGRSEGVSARDLEARLLALLPHLGSGGRQSGGETQSPIEDAKKEGGVGGEVGGGGAKSSGTGSFARFSV